MSGGGGTPRRSSWFLRERWRSVGGLVANDRGQERIFACAAVVLAVLIAFGLRAFRVGTSWDLGEDELDYLQMSQGVLRVLWPVGWDGGPFYLHPPLFFFMEAAHMKLFGITGDLDLIQQIYRVRYLNAICGGISAGALLWLGRRLAGWPAGIASAAIFALDPFSVKMNSRNFLEPSAIMWTLLGYCVLVSALDRGSSRLVFWTRTVLAGVLFGLALLTKEKTVFVTLLPLGACFVLGWVLPRLRSALIGLVALVVYASYPLAVYARGDWATFADQKAAGALRLAGILQVTGFNQQGGPSFLNAVIHRLDEFATTYVFLATGVVAVCVLFLTDLGNKVPARRLLIAWTTSAYAFLGYSMTLGTLEEHFFYYLVVPSILATAAATTVALRKVRETDFGKYPPGGVWGDRARWRARRALEVGTAVSVAVLALWSAYVWATIHTVPDNGYERVAYYLEELPAGSRVAVTSGVAEIIIEGYAGDGALMSVKAMRDEDIDYVIMSSYLSNNGWGQPPPEVYRWVKDHGQLAFGFEGSTHGLMGVWLLDSSPYARVDGSDIPDTVPDVGRASRASAAEKSNGCGGNDDGCIRALVAEAAPKAEYVGGRIDVDIDGPAPARNVLYFKDPTMGRCQYRQLERISDDASTHYVAIVAGDGSYRRENGENCVPEIGR